MQSAKQPLKSSALIVFDLPYARQVVLMNACGTPDKVKDALRKACSHRRPIVALKSNHYVANCIGHLMRLSQDIVELWPYADLKNDLPLITGVGYRYEIRLDGSTPVIEWGDPHKTSQVEPLFRFLGNEWKRPYTKPKRKGGRRGRKSTWRKNFAHLIDNVPENERIESKQKAQRGKTLDLNHLVKRVGKKLRINFAEVIEDLAAMSLRDREEMDPEYESRQRAIESREQQA
jgi:hypothetical protein